jgi:dTDP-4-dehydrorhamnose 3,5-epimerase/reductase
MELRVTESDLKGLYVIDLAIHADSRGSFREAYQAEKLEQLGLPRLGAVQWNISENLRPGIVRGIHAEPWDKYIHAVMGEAFAAIVDLRTDSPSFGQLRTFILNQTNALFVSRGIGNAYQVLKAPCAYGYLVNAHWKPGTVYPAIHYADPELNIRWPLPIGSDDVSGKDWKNPTLREAFPGKF